MSSSPSQDFVQTAGFRGPTSVRYRDLSGGPSRASSANAHDVVVADECEVLRLGLRQLLQSGPGLRVIAEAADGRDALDAVRRLRPRLIVLDIHLPILGGIDVVQRIASFEFNVVPIAFTSRTDRLSVVRMLKAGARGIVPKAAAATELVHAVEVVMRGQTYLSPSIAEIISRLATRADRGADLKPAADLLSTRETEVLQGIALGKQNKEIADELQVAVRTIESHRSQLMRKLDLRSVAALTKYAIREGLASIEH